MVVVAHRPEPLDVDSLHTEEARSSVSRSFSGRGPRRRRTCAATVSRRLQLGSELETKRLLQTLVHQLVEQEARSQFPYDRPHRGTQSLPVGVAASPWA